MVWVRSWAVKVSRSSPPTTACPLASCIRPTLEDAAAAVAWTVKNITSHGGDPTRVFIGGHSAGAYLAAQLSLDPSYLRAHGLDLSDIRGTVPISPFLYVDEVASDRPKTVWGIDEAVWREASVKPYIGSGKPSMLLIYADGDDDWCREQNERLKMELEGTGTATSTRSRLPSHSRKPPVEDGRGGPPQNKPDRRVHQKSLTRPEVASSEGPSIGPSYVRPRSQGGLRTRNCASTL